jgi:hypothetical protein
MDELAGVLSREQLLLEHQLFKLVELRELLANGESRFLPWAAEELDRATARLREAELHRALVVNRVAADVGRGDAGLSLRALAESTPEPYAAIFAGQRRAMLALTSELHECVRRCRDSAGDGESMVQQVLERVDKDAGSAPADRRTARPAAPLVLTW